MRGEAQMAPKGLERLFERILQAGEGYYFEESGFTPEDYF